ncbi:MAG: aldo/keto reductase [Candidatus Limnocylindrales bacterium]
MDYRRLGHSGLLVSEVGLGTNNFGTRLDKARGRDVLDQALELGVTFIDTADIYGRGASESLLGTLLGPRRQQVILATKVGMPMGASPYETGLSRRWIVQSLEASLRRLGTDWIDLYQLHQPDPETPIEETLRALDDLVRAGKVRYAGYSNFAAWQLVDADWTARTSHLARPISAQDHYNLLVRHIEPELLPACHALGLGLIPYYPLESGFLTGKFREGSTPPGARLSEGPRAGDVLTSDNFARLARLSQFAEERHHTLLGLAIGWLLSHAEVASVIASASSAEQVRQNVQASTWRLDASEIEAVAAI